MSSSASKWLNCALILFSSVFKTLSVLQWRIYKCQWIRNFCYFSLIYSVLEFWFEGYAFRCVIRMLFIYAINSGFIYTGCNRRNGPDFGRVFLRSNYTDITQTPISKVERLQRYWSEKRVDFFGVCVLYSFPWRHSPLSLNCIPMLELM